MKLLWISLLVFAVDLFTKQIVRIQMSLGQSITVIGDDLLRWTYIENPGMAFGIDPGNKLLFSIFTVGIVIWLCYYFWSVRNETMKLRVPLAIVLGGAFGNLFDRLFYGIWFQEDGFLHGRVVDFIDFDIPNIDMFGIHMNRWPVFNIADIAVSCGVIALILFYRPEEPKTESTIIERPTENTES